MIAKNCNQDTAWFRVLESEWPEVKKLRAIALLGNYDKNYLYHLSLIRCCMSRYV
jgi:hypothetical protein